MVLRYFLLLILIAVILPLKASFTGGKDSSRVSFSFPLKKDKIFKNFKVNRNFYVEDSENKGGTRRFMNLKYSGWVRFYTQFRNMPLRYFPQTTAQKKTTINGFDVSNGQGTGDQNPFMLLRIEGNPTSKTYFMVEYGIDNQMTGDIINGGFGPISGTNVIYNRRISGYRVFQFQASTHTKVGTFKIIAGGGANWYSISPFTLWNYSAFQYRDDMSLRYPWEPEGKPFSRYRSYYSMNNMARDSRWGMAATQGFVLEGKGLPKGFGFALLYGKTDNSGGFQTYLSKTPINMAAGRIEKAIKTHKIAVNYFSQFGSIDQANLFRLDQKIASFETKLNFRNLKIFAEIGAGQYRDSVISKNYYELLYKKPMNRSDSAMSYNYTWKPIINVEARTSKELTLIPLSLQFYYIDKSMVNINSGVLNSSNRHALGTYSNIGTASDITTYEGLITQPGQMTNNRWAFNLKHEGSIKRLKIMVALNSGQELQNQYNIITFQHMANAFTRSRFDYFMSQYGPYQRLLQAYRITFEKVFITDPASVTSTYKKAYNSLNLSLKYNLQFLGKDLILSTYNNYSSVTDKFSPVPTFTDKAFLRFFYSEYMAFYHLHPKVSVLGFCSFERAKANKRTEMVDDKGNLIVDPVTHNPTYSPNGKARDQFGYGYGFGIDYDYSSRAGLYLRQRWFSHKDRNFILDAFKGYETSLELKLFF